MNSPQNARTVIFCDLDGTLMVNPFHGFVFPEVYSRIGTHAGLSVESVRQLVMTEFDRRLTNPPPDNLPWVMDWDDIVQTVAARFGASLPPDLCETLATQHANPPDSSTLDDAVTALRRVREVGGRWLVVASMGLAKYQSPVMRGIGLYDCFDDFLMPDLTNCLKTDACFYQQYLNDGHAHRRLHISLGDNYIHDVVFPKSLGFYSVLRLPVPELNDVPPFERPPHIHHYGSRIQFYPVDPALATTLPDAVITHLSELPDVISQIERNGTRG